MSVLIEKACMMHLFMLADDYYFSRWTQAKRNDAIVLYYTQQCHHVGIFRNTVNPCECVMLCPESLDMCLCLCQRITNYIELYT